MAATASFDVADGMRIALVGGGKMGEAIMGGWIGAGMKTPADVACGPENFVVANSGRPRAPVTSCRSATAWRAWSDARRHRRGGFRAACREAPSHDGRARRRHRGRGRLCGRAGRAPCSCPSPPGFPTARLASGASRRGRAWCAPCRTPRFSSARASPTVTGGSAQCGRRTTWRSCRRSVRLPRGTACVVDEDGHRRRRRAQRIGAGLRCRLRWRRCAMRVQALGLDAALGRTAWRSRPCAAPSSSWRARARTPETDARGRVQPGRLHTCGACRHGRGRALRPPYAAGRVRRRTPIEGVGPVLSFKYLHRRRLSTCTAC